MHVRMGISTCKQKFCLDGSKTKKTPIFPSMVIGLDISRWCSKWVASHLHNKLVTSPARLIPIYTHGSRNKIRAKYIAQRHITQVITWFELKTLVLKFQYSAIATLNPLITKHYSGFVNYTVACAICIIKWHQYTFRMYSYTPRTLRACCSRSKFRILKIRESSARALFLYNCTPNISRSADASLSVA